MYQIAIWDTALSQADVNFLDSNVGHDFLTDEGGYTSSANLQHWWRFCFDRGDIGRDYGLAASGTIDINQDGTVDSGDCRIDAPR